MDQKITPEFLRQMSGGLYLEELDVHTRPCTVTKVNDRTFRIILTQEQFCKEAIEMAKACQDAGDPVVTRIFQPIVKVDVL